MSKQPLHITNGNVLTDYLNELDIVGKKLTWQEMLCEGPTIIEVNSKKFLDARKSFFSEFYDIDLDTDQIKSELNKLNDYKEYSEIILWFEYDLFCHVNMIAVINLILQKKIDLPISLVCSGRIKGSKILKGLSELNAEQLIDHYKKRVKLNHKDLDLAKTLWGIYCGKDHNLLKPYIVTESSFEYLSNCLKAHLERFPDLIYGLNVLEKNIMEIVKNNSIKSKHHLLGYVLNYQGYYGYGDLQISRIIEKLSVFFTNEEQHITLNRKGHEALLGQHNVAMEIDNNMVYGGLKKFDFQFNKKQNKLVKTVLNAY
ncbi:DUF1835 domain-containing protein [Flavivirga spongiicola]|uniref:DUF1835 domain-containing protein n=1 Tax=Flavivirga spongiicola TaxID=421621 RepID=A0ABU7XYW9_9FLAO|nr:DUF1835 domain-containing protein [Flavivirga sp. MEBiC05379]MDO5980643.1 DUF1835 domain-containing protein [Flavivirga sp. MEBiC05379]